MRSKLIDRVAEKLGITDPKRKAKLAATTREAKLGSIPYAELTARWQNLLDPAERKAIGSALGKPVKATAKDAQHVRYAVDHSFERASVVDERRLLTLALRHGIGEVTPEGVRAEADQLKLLKRAQDGRTWVTTRSVLEEENRLIRFAASGKGACEPIERAPRISMIESADSHLSQEQQAAVAHVLESPDRVMILRGVAGSGKTTLTREAVRRIEATGKPVVMLAPSAQASRGVLRDEGFSEADTLARFLLDAKMQASANNGVIWLDEAGLVGSKTLGKLFDVAKELNARIVLAGDKRQMESVERGSPLRLLESTAGLKVAEVREIRRQRGDYKEAVKLLARGDAAAGLVQLDRMGCVKLLPVWDSYAPVARDYVEQLSASKDRENSVLIVSPTHAEAAKITAEVRQQLKAAQLVGQNEHSFTRLMPLQWTEAERADPSRYSGDEVLQLHRTSGDFKAGERVRASTMQATPRPAAAEHFSTYSSDRIQFASGDLIRITANGKSKDGTHKLNNGAVYTVAGFTREGDVRLKNGWNVDRSFGHWAYGYVSTAHAAQGRTVDHTIVVQSRLSSPAASQAGFYVAASRGRKSISVWTDNKQDLKEMATRHSPRPSAIELARKPKPNFYRRVRDAMDRVRLARLVAAHSRIEPTPQHQPEWSYAR